MRGPSSEAWGVPSAELGVGKGKGEEKSAKSLNSPECPSCVTQVSHSISLSFSLLVSTVGRVIMFHRTGMFKPVELMG